MPPPKLAVNSNGEGGREKPVGVITFNDSKSGSDELHLADASNAVALYGLCIAVTALFLATGTTLCLYYLGLATTLSAVITLGLLVVVSSFSTYKTGFLCP